MEKNNLISQSEAARIIEELTGKKISRQAISKIKKSGTYNFFEGTNVNTDHQDWKSYLHERKTNGNNSVKNNLVKAENNKSESAESKKKTAKKSSAKAKAKSKAKSKSNSKKSDVEKKESERQKNSLNGGVDLANYVPQNIADVKRLTEIQKLNIEMRVRLDELIELEMMVSAMSAISQNIQGHFVDLGRRVSNKICKKLDRQGMEKEVEKIINPVVARGIQEIKKAMSENIELKTIDQE